MLKHNTFISYIYQIKTRNLITLITISAALFTSKAFAHDCNLVVGDELESNVKSYQANYSIYLNALPAEAFKQALINLKAYCCSQVIQKSCTEKELKNLPKEYPESAYLFDQLLDVAMRRLDGIKSLAYGLEPDPTAAARRTYITQAAENPNGNQSKTIQDTYQRYRKIHAFPIENTLLINYNTDIAAVSLEDKYDTLCDIIKEIYNIQRNDRIILGGYADSNSFLGRCATLVETRVKRENTYVKLVMTQVANNLFDNTMKAYTQQHFVEEKLMNLRNLISKVKSIFKTIVKQAPASKTCSK